MKHITYWGGIYRMSDRNYLRLLRTIAKGEDVAIDRFGKQIAVHEADITDMTADNAKFELDIKEGRVK